MADFNVSVTMSNEPANQDISAGSTNNFIVSNPLSGSSYFALETVKNSNGAYDSNSPKNLEGTITGDSGIPTIIKDNYKAGVVVSPGGGTFVFTPTNSITANTLRFRGTGAGTTSTSSLPSFIGLLDEFGTDCIGSYSVRKLTADYNGPAMTVRRDSDQAEEDINFTSDGNLDTSALTTFAGSSDVFVKHWYDQIGNRTASQTSAINQPRIVDSGTVIEINNQPALQYNNTDELTISSSLSYELYSGSTAQADGYDGFAFSIVYKSADETTNDSILEYQGSSDFNSSGFRLRDGAFQLRTTATNVSLFVTTNRENQQLYWVNVSESRNFTGYINNAFQGEATISQEKTWGTNRIGADVNGGTTRISGSLQEVIFWSASQTGSGELSHKDIRTDVFNDSNTYFGITQYERIYRIL